MCGVGEELAGVDEVLVDVVEVAEEHLAPVDEVVEGFGGGAATYIYMV